MVRQRLNRAIFNERDFVILFPNFGDPSHVS
jgi:hypothetical protein